MISREMLRGKKSITEPYLLFASLTFSRATTRKLVAASLTLGYSFFSPLTRLNISFPSAEGSVSMTSWSMTSLSFFFTSFNECPATEISGSGRGLYVDFHHVLVVKFL